MTDGFVQPLQMCSIQFESVFIRSSKHLSTMFRPGMQTGRCVWTTLHGNACKSYAMPWLPIQKFDITAARKATKKICLCNSHFNNIRKLSTCILAPKFEQDYPSQYPRKYKQRFSEGAHKHNTWNLGSLIHINRYIGTSHRVCTNLASNMSHKDVKTYWRDLLETLPEGHDRYMSIDEWNTIDSQVKNLFKFWPVMLMKHLAQHKRTVFEIGKSLFQYWKYSENGRFNLMMWTAFALLCAKEESGSGKELVYKIYEEICEASDLFDSTTATTLIKTFSLTERWKECLKFFEMVTVTDDLTTEHYSPVAVAAIRNADLKTAHKLLHDMGEKDILPKDEVFLCMMEQDDDQNGLVMNMLQQIRTYEWTVSAAVAESIKSWFESKSSDEWTGHIVKIPSSGRCPITKHHLEPLKDLTDEEFEELRSVLLEKAIISGDIFMKTSPGELKKFQTFVQNTAPFDVVMDGLNVAFMMSQKKKLSTKTRQLKAVVQKFYQDGKRVFVMGRKHMKSWPYQDMKDIEKMAHVFYADNISQDDPFLLYAALSSGKHTRLLTHDEFRDHRFLLGPELGQRFRTWQRMHQLFLEEIKWVSGKPHLQIRFPVKHKTVAQQHLQGWLLPFEDKSDRPSFATPDSWLCLVKRH